MNHPIIPPCEINRVQLAREYIDKLDSDWLATDENGDPVARLPGWLTNEQALQILPVILAMRQLGEEIGFRRGVARAAHAAANLLRTAG